ncbi:hypothetical protein [Actinopolymorpha pittospori]|uniref:Uncharacterized protein n=1 Tax=Actinopolymorpha pittospori TaxID=648752 RepID=A0A927N030_9ACTN|nr:hypothetical protein [Actinopolymorpha pittospori]
MFAYLRWIVDAIPGADVLAREIRLLADHRDDLVAERTHVINRLRWHLHELDPSWQPPARTLWRPRHLATITARLAGVDGLIVRLARTMVERCHALTVQIRATDRAPPR